VELVQGYVDTKLDVDGCYDYAICSSIMQYADYKGILMNALRAIDGSGVIVVFSEVFPDLEPEKAELFSLYYSLIPHFKGFPKLSDILDFLSKKCECSYKVKDNVVKIDVST